MSIKYKFDVMDALKKAGYSSYRIRKEKIFGESTLQMFRRGEFVSSGNNIEMLCEMLNCQPGDLLEYVPEVQD